MLTFAVMFATPLLFFLLQATNVSYATGSSSLLRKALSDSLRNLSR